MHARNIHHGERYWTFAPSIEEESYAFAECPRKPYMVKAVWSESDTGMVLKVHAFDKETGEIDNDSNATAYPPVDKDFNYADVFPNENEAWAAWKVAAGKHASKQIEDGFRTLAHIVSLVDGVSDKVADKTLDEKSIIHYKNTEAYVKEKVNEYVSRCKGTILEPLITSDLIRQIQASFETEYYKKLAGYYRAEYFAIEGSKK